MARLAPEAGLPQPRPSPQPVFRPVENVLHTTRWNSFRFPKNRSTGSRAACTSQSSRRCRIFRPESVLFGVGPARSVVGTPRPKRTAWPPGTNAGSSSRRRPTHVPRTASIRTASSAAGLSRRAAVHPLPVPRASDPGVHRRIQSRSRETLPQKRGKRPIERFRQSPRQTRVPLCRRGTRSPAWRQVRNCQLGSTAATGPEASTGPCPLSPGDNDMLTAAETVSSTPCALRQLHVNRLASVPPLQGAQQFSQRLAWRFNPTPQ